MKIQIREDKVIIDGYVNAVERLSKPLSGKIRGIVGKFVERIKAGCFKRALSRNDDVKILLNHDWTRILGDTKTNLKLEEDAIGLHASAEITDKEVVESAKRGDLVGWSFGFRDVDVDESKDEGGFPLREVSDIDLIEVSILDRTRTPAYDGTLIQARDESGEEINTRDLSVYDDNVQEMEADAFANMIAEKVAAILLPALSQREKEKFNDEKINEIQKFIEKVKGGTK